MKPARYALVHVEWEDPNTMNLGCWASRSEVRKAETTHVRSVGWLVRDDPKVIAIASCHIARGGTEVSGCTLIPRGCVVHIETLAEAG